MQLQHASKIFLFDWQHNKFKVSTLSDKRAGGNSDEKKIEMWIVKWDVSFLQK